MASSNILFIPNSSGEIDKISVERNKRNDRFGMGLMEVSVFSKVYNLSEAVNAFHYNCGIFSTWVVLKVDRKWTVSFPRLSFNIFMCLLSSFSMYLIFSKEPAKKDTLLWALVQLELFLFSLCQAVGFFSQMIYEKEIQRIVDSTDRLTQTMSKIGSKRLTFGNPSLLCLFFNTLPLVASGVLKVLKMEVNDLIICLSSIYHTSWLGFIMLMDVFNIIFLIKSVYFTLSYLNNYLVSLKYGFYKISRSYHEKIELCCKVYDELCSQVESINRVFGHQLLVVFIITFTKIVDNLYLIVILKNSIKNLENIKEISVPLVWVTFAFSLSILIVKVCDSLVAKAKEFHELVFRLMIRDATCTLSTNIKLLLHVLMKRKMVITATGFFNIDYTLLHSMVAAATTYLVILIQFDDTLPQGEENGISNFTSASENITFNF